MARDIASVVDKDTRDDVDAHGEPLLPMPDGPRSEGGPPTRPPESAEPTPPDLLPAEPALSSLSLPEPVEPWVPDLTPEPQPGPQTAKEPATEPEPETEPEPDVVSDPPPLEQPDAEEAARPAVPEIAIAPAAAPQAPVTPQDTVAEPPAPSASQPPQTDADHGPGWSSAIADALAAPETPHDAPPPRHDGTAFTEAAEGLFRPGAASRDEDTHLITLGRRLNPSLAVPKPVAPVIAPRPEPAFEERHAAHTPTWTSGTWQDRLRIAARYTAYLVGGYLALVVVLIVLFRFVNPPGSMLMLTQAATGTAIDRTWAPLSAISPNLIRAVIVSEDGRFCEHGGIDTAAIREAIERAARGTPRGASTISMQVTKNLFLWNAKSYVRKVIEIPLTLVMELLWPKRRVLEVYLNIAEWGPGIFGAEAAARHHFGKRAANLNEREAALLAAVLPNPLVRNAGRPSSQTSAKARVVQARVKAYGAVASCVTAAAPAPAAGTAKPAVANPAAKAQRPQRKPAPQRPAARKNAADEWAPTLNFGPR